MLTRVTIMEIRLFAYVERLSVRLRNSNHLMVKSFNMPQSMGYNIRAFQIYLRIHKITITRIGLGLNTILFM